MRFNKRRTKIRNSQRGEKDKRLLFLSSGIILWCLLLIFRLFVLQIFEHDFYLALAADQRDISAKLFPTRGDILIQDKKGGIYPFATNEDRFLVYANTNEVDDAEKEAKALASALNTDNEEIKRHLEKEKDPFEPIEHGVLRTKVDEIKKMELSGIYFAEESYRVYPLGNLGSQVVGFVGEDINGVKKGRYGLENYFDKQLSGQEGFLQGERDTGGRTIPFGINKFQEAQDGQSLILTIDRNIEYIACQKLDEAVQKHGATGGSLIIMEPKTGKILAMCGAPDFDPNNYSKVKDISVFKNSAVTDQYEPGSVFKVMTMAAALDSGVLDPETVYEDIGHLKIGSYVISNSDNKAHGIQTMTQVLEQSLNTGAVFAARKVGLENFRNYVKKFGFGQKTGIELDNEAKGDLNSLDQKQEIYLATASFGQGISVTPIQLAAFVGAIANGGQLMKPYIIDKIKQKDDIVFESRPQSVRQVILPKSATLLSGMMTQVIENGHGKQAGVQGYFIAGKTGTAQIPRQEGPGYEINETIGTFVGFAPVENPKFVMVVRIDRPKDVKFAESTAAPLFGDIAKFMLQYFEVKPTRVVK